VFELNEIQFVKEKAIQSGKWALIARVSQVLGGSIMLIILPFWLAPDDFGIITMFTSVLALVMILQQAGLMEATVQREQDIETVRDAAFWLSALISLALYLIVYSSAPFLSNFFGDFRLIPPLRIASLQIILLGFSNIPLAWMQRQFQYRSYALIHFTSSLVMMGIAIVFAIRGAGYWAYIAGILSGAATRLILLVFYIDWRPRFRFKIYWWEVIIKFSGFVLLEMVFGWLLVWFDNVVVAKHLGSEAAGIYSLAFNFATMAISLPISAITGVTLSTFSRLQNDMDSLRSTYLKGTGLITSYAIPAGIGLSLVGPALVNTIYPGRWDSLRSILPILALYAGFGHIWILNTDVFKAIGKPEIMLKIYIPVLSIVLPVYWWSSQIGLFEFTIARSLIVLVGALPHTYFAIRNLGLDKNYLYHIVRAPLISSGIMALFVWAGIKICNQISFPNNGIQLVYLAGVIAIGGIIYWLTMGRIASDFPRRVTDLYCRSMGIVGPHE